VSLLINACTVRFTEKILVCNGHWPMILNGFMKFRIQNLHDAIILVCALTTKLLRVLQWQWEPPQTLWVDSSTSGAKAPAGN
jgi:hypothetical protein